MDKEVKLRFIDLNEFFVILSGRIKIEWLV